MKAESRKQKAESGEDGSGNVARGPGICETQAGASGCLRDAAGYGGLGGGRRNWFAQWFETTRRPSWVIAAIVLLLYAPFAGGGFVIDDHRLLRHLAEFSAGQRAHLDLYKFLSGGEDNIRQRAEGWYPWWLMDSVRYRHLRPVSEWCIYGEFRLFGRNAIAYRLVSLGLYALGCALVLRVFRLFGGAERTARWGALIFAVAAAHAIPVVFVSAQCDLLALVLGMGAVLLAGRYLGREARGLRLADCAGEVGSGERPPSGGAGGEGLHNAIESREGGGSRDADAARGAGVAKRKPQRRVWALIAAVVVFGVGMGTKEAVLALAAAPVLGWMATNKWRMANSDWRKGPGDAVPPQGILIGGGERGGSRWPELRRAMIATGVLSIVGLAFLAAYVKGGYGSNASVMLDPAGATGDYLANMPGRVVVLLTTWFIPLNPFIFYFRPEWHIGVYVFGVVGAAGLLLLGRMYWRHHRGESTTVAMALWPLPFLPLLACTGPDDRILMLPGVGLAYLAAAWLTRPQEDGSLRLRRLPLVMFVGSQVAVTLIVAGVMGTIEADTKRVMGSAIAACDLRLAKEENVKTSKRQNVENESGDAENPAAPIASRRPQATSLESPPTGIAPRTAPLATQDSGLKSQDSPPQWIFFLNAAYDFQPLFAQDALRAMPGGARYHVTFLCDVPNPTVTVVDDHTLRLSADGRGMLGRFLGLMGRERGRSRRIGDTGLSGEFEGRITRKTGEDVREVELYFRESLSSGRYHFLLSTPSGPVRRWEGAMAGR